MLKVNNKYTGIGWMFLVIIHFIHVIRISLTLERLESTKVSHILKQTGKCFGPGTSL